MPWWSWIVIWVALAALAALFAVVLGLWIFRRMMATVHEAETVGELLGNSDFARTAPSNTPASEVPAVFLSPATARALRDEGKKARGAARRERRVRMRTERNQPQLLRDLPHL